MEIKQNLEDLQKSIMTMLPELEKFKDSANNMLKAKERKLAMINGFATEVGIHAENRVIFNFPNEKEARDFYDNLTSK